MSLKAKANEVLSDEQLKLKLDRARWWALTRYPFYGGPLCNLADVLCSVPTAATDGKRIYWGRAFLSRMDEEETRFVLLHELMHCLHMHLWRLPKTREGNIAGDYAINLSLQAIEGARMPKEGLLDQQYANMAEEEILARLPKQKGGGEGSEHGGFPGQPGSGDPNDPGQMPDDVGGCGGFVDPAKDKDVDGGDKDEPKKAKPKGPGKGPGDKDGDAEGEGIKEDSLKDRWERALIQAEITAKVLNQGNLPGNMERLLKRVRAQDLDWRQETADFIRQAIGTKNDWTRAAKRHAHQPVIYPRKKKDGLGLIVFVRDTSGSVTDQELAEYTALINACVAENNCEGVVYDCDTHVRETYRISGTDPCPPHAIGGGGTAFEPPFKAALSLIDDGEEISGLVYITDLCGSFPTEHPEFPTLWIVKQGHRDLAAPFGRTIHIA